MAGNFSAGLSAGRGLREQRQQERQRSIASEVKEKEKRTTDFQQGSTQTIQAIVGARQNGAPIEQLEPLANAVLKTNQMLILNGDIPPESLGLTRQTLSTALNTKTNAEVALEEDARKTTLAASNKSAEVIAEQTAKAKFPDKPELRTIGNQIIQINQVEGGVETEVVFSGEAPTGTPNPQTFLNPETEKFFTVDANNIEEVKAAQAIGAFKQTPPSGGAAPITAGQRLAAGFALRTKDAGAVLDDIGDQFTGVLSRGVGAVPAGLKTEDRQRFDQATENFINATLRRESGAAISPTEFTTANVQYIPQVGDKDDVLAQKKRNREVIIKALELEAGSAFAELETALPTDSVDVNGKMMPVGSTIDLPNGQRATILQNGSLRIL